MARRHRRRGRHSFKIPVISVAILAGQALAAHQMGGDAVNSLNAFQRFYTGVDLVSGGFRADQLLLGWTPWFAKGLISKVARPLGARPKIPFGLPISIS